MRKLKLFLAASFVMGMMAVNVSWVLSSNNSEGFFGQFVGMDLDALAVGGETVPTDPPPPEKRLKKMSCTCPNGKKDDGFTLKCYTTGDLEKCTPTQQGSNACYEASWTGKITMCKEG